MSAKIIIIIIILVNTYDPCQNAVVRSQMADHDLAHSQRFFTRKIFCSFVTPALIRTEIQKKGDWKRNFYEIFA